MHLPAWAPAMAIPDRNPLTVEGVTLGQALFHDKRLSGSGQMSCASCHRPGMAFAQRGVVQVAGRNTPSLLNVGWQKALFWDGGVASLESVALAPLHSSAGNGRKYRGGPDFVAHRCPLPAYGQAGVRYGYGREHSFFAIPCSIPTNVDFAGVSGGWPINLVQFQGALGTPSLYQVMRALPSAAFLYRFWIPPHLAWGLWFRSNPWICPAMGGFG